jgi:glucokinase
VFGLVDIGGTKLLAAVAGSERRPGPSLRRPTPDAAPLETLVDMLDDVRCGASLDAIALAVPGPFDRSRGALLEPRNIATAWHHLPIAGRLGEHYGCRVVLENDANCAGLAEAVVGSGRGMRRVVYFTVSTGVGTGVVVDGRLVTGRHDTEGGHQVLWPRWLGGPACRCGGYGCLEALVSGPSIARRFGVAAEQLDDTDAWADVGRWLGLAIVNAVAMHDPDAVVFGGGVIASWDRFWPSLSATVDQYLHLQARPVITRGTLGEDRNLWGALALLDQPGAG